MVCSLITVRTSWKLHFCVLTHKKVLTVESFQLSVKFTGAASPQHLQNSDAKWHKVGI